MPLPVASGNSISMLQIATEFGDTRPYSLSEFYRGGGRVPVSNPAVPTGGAISMGNFYGAQAGSTNIQVPLVISAPTINYDVGPNALASPLYVAGRSDIVVTVGPGVIVGASTPVNYAILVPNTLNNPLDTVTIDNSGFVWGRGGAGGSGSPNAFGSPGSPGGTAIVAQRPTTVINRASGNIAGGGGGGGGGQGYTYPVGKTVAFVPGGGGGGGGGSRDLTNLGGPGGPPNGGSGSGAPTGAGGSFGVASNGPSGFAGPGGPGGAVGNSGFPGGQSPNSSYVPGGPTSGGQAGYYINALNPVTPLTPYVTLVNNGTVLGLIN